ncbi:MAG: PadR family transcriptional regulator [Deltaproteobacteria bacterium]|nr:PadR family transcriptional regulator [Deltaproteobacteria bacterium]
MNIHTIILGFLMKKSMTGYELKNAFSLSFSFFSGISFGSIYPALKKMEQEGLISMRLEIQESAPNKKVYSITAAGEKAFHSLLKTPLLPERTRNAFLARLFFFSYLDAEDRLEISEQYLRNILEEQERLEAVRPQIEETADPFQKECFLFGVRIFAAYVENVSRTLETLKRISE